MRRNRIPNAEIGIIHAFLCVLLILQNAARKIMANRPIFAVQRFDCKLRTCKEQINDLNIIHKESHPSIYYLANRGEILHQSKNFYREFWKIPCSPLSYCCPNIKSNTTSKISFLHPDRFSFHSITDVRGYQTLEGFQNMFAMSFGTNASAPTVFSNSSKYVQVCGAFFLRLSIISESLPWMMQ